VSVHAAAVVAAPHPTPVSVLGTARLTAHPQALGRWSTTNRLYRAGEGNAARTATGSQMTESTTRPNDFGELPSEANASANAPEQPAPADRWGRLKDEWDRRLQPGEQSVVIAWSSFTATFAGVRALTHWIHDGHGPSGGGISLGGHHFHHYNIGIAGLATIGAIALRGGERHRRHPATAAAYGSALALIVDELALLIDLKDVYWAREGRASVDAAITLAAVGATVAAGLPFWPHARRVLRN
jgi:hypothetical protein